MSETHVPAEMRRAVVTRAGRVCEYCLVSEDVHPRTFHIDHVIGEKHFGPTDVENLAYSCPACNHAKGSDIGSIDWQYRQLVRFYNPRCDRWYEHFELVGPTIEALTDIGRVTVLIFQFNYADRVTDREALIGDGLYPSPEALQRMQPPMP